MNLNKKDVLDALKEYISRKEGSMAHWENTSDNGSDFRSSEEKILCELYKKGYIGIDGYSHATGRPYHALTKKGLDLFRKLSNELNIVL